MRIQLTICLDDDDRRLCFANGEYMCLSKHILQRPLGEIINKAIENERARLDLHKANVTHMLEGKS